MILKIVTYPSPLLKKKSAPVEKVDKEVRTLIDNMFETMYDAPGVGLAAPQIGLLKQILIVDTGRLEDEERKPDPKVLINPKIVTREGKITWEEGCLSLPQLIVPIERSKNVIVEALDQNGKLIKHLAEDLLAVAFQHEMDHLNGILLVDRLSSLKRDLYKRKMKKIAKGETVEQEVPKGKGPAYIG
jgi:peptide deformylase